MSEVLTCPVGFSWCSTPPSVPDGAPVRDKIAALCNHAIKVHRAGPGDAWEAASQVYYIECRKWAAELTNDQSVPDAAAAPVED